MTKARAARHWHLWRQPAEHSSEGARSAEPSPARSGALPRLYEDQTRTYQALVILVVFVVVLCAIDLFVGERRPRAAGLAINIGYGTAGSLLATLLVTLTQLWLRIRDRKDQSAAALKVLGVRPERGTAVAIVMTARNMQEFGGPTARNSDETAAGAAGGENNTVYVRRDMLLVTDIIRLMQRAGLEPPIIVSDAKFLDGLKDRARSERVEVDTGVREWTAVNNVIVIGLWGNKVTEVLSRADDAVMPFRLVRTNEGKVIRFYARDAPADSVVTSSPAQVHERDNPEAKGVAFIGRFHMADSVVAVLGGAYGLPTARLGDLLLDEERLVKLTSVPGEEDLWTTLLCPPRPHRFQDYYVDPPRRSKPHVPPVRLVKLLNEHLSPAGKREVDLTAHDPRPAEAQRGS